MSEFYIREAKPEDLQTIIDLIIELAEYEKLPEEAAATPEMLRHNLFESPSAYVLLAFSKSDKPVGFALYFFNFSSWTGKPGIYLEDLYVKEEFRENGIGKALFKQLGRIAREKGCPRIDWTVLKWNQQAIGFYTEVLKATLLEEWVDMRLEGDGLCNLERLSTPHVALDSV